MKFTSIVSLHTNPTACGVAKFGVELAKRLAVPFVGLNDYVGDYPLYSLKASEMNAHGHVIWTGHPNYGLFWHDAGLPVYTERASIVFYADPSLGSPGLWCPSLLTPSKPRTVCLFSFGMAHKLQTAHYAKVRQLLDAAGLRYTLRVSVGLHEGTSLSDATKHFDALKDIMGPEHVTILGCLSDDAVSEELSAADYVLAFFEKGVRANNTTVHAALSYDKTVITNFDDDSPFFPFFPGVTDLADLDCWPASQPHYSWERLISAMDTLCAASPSTAAR